MKVTIYDGGIEVLSDEIDDELDAKILFNEYLSSQGTYFEIE